MKRLICLLVLVLLVGLIACERNEPSSIIGPQLAKGGIQPISIMASLRDAEGDKIVSDSVTDPYYGFYGYVDGSCGVEADLGEDAAVWPRVRPIRGKEPLCGEPRVFHALDERTTSPGWFFLIKEVGQVQEGAPEKHIAVFQGDTWKCRFTNSWSTVGSGFEGDSVLVTRQGASWVVQSVDPHRAVCTSGDYPDTAVVVLPFQLTFTPK